MGIARSDTIGHPVRNLSLEGIPPTAKLVMVVGPTGSGKSTILRNLNGALQAPRHSINVEFHGGLMPTIAQGISDPDAAHFISEMFASAELAAVDSNQTAQEIVNAAFEPLASTFQRIFPSFTICAVRAKALGGSTIQITKGVASYDWKQLSSGELQIFEVLLKLMLGPKRYPRQLSFLDEPDKHVHAHLQAALLEECCTLVPQGSQLWIATQSIGMIHKAVELYRSRPGEVVFLEATLDYDRQTVLEPVTPDRSFVKRILKVAIHDLADLVAPEEIIICEGGPRSTTAPTATKGKPKNAAFDAEAYGIIFSGSHPKTEFVSAGCSNDVLKDTIKLEVAINLLVPGVRTIKLIDHDNRSSHEVAQLRKSARVLSRYSIENYLWSDEILEMFMRVKGCSVPDQQRILAAKARLVGRSPGAPEDPMEYTKDIDGLLYQECMSIPQLRGLGGNTNEFALRELAPLVTEDTNTYKVLEQDVFS